MLLGVTSATLRASRGNGGTFSLFESPSTTVDDTRARFGLGVDSGVWSCCSQRELVGFSDDRWDRLPRTELRVERVVGIVVLQGLEDGPDGRWARLKDAWTAENEINTPDAFRLRS